MFENFELALNIIYAISVLMTGWAIYEIMNAVMKKLSR